MTDERSSEATPPAQFQDDFFDPTFLSELEELAGTRPILHTAAVSSTLHEKLNDFLSASHGGRAVGPLTEDVFVRLTGDALAERTNDLIELCRQGPKREALQAVENFIVFFQTLVPMLPPESAVEIRRFFFHLVPTLIHIAHNDFSDRDETKRNEGLTALRNLEAILTEISTVRLAPTESDLVFKNIDQLAAFIAVGEYTMANEAISSRLLGIIRKNKLTRALFRLMEVEVSIQRYLRERLGYLTPQLRVPEDFSALTDYGPVRILYEFGPDHVARPFIQVQLPNIPLLRDVVLHLASQDESGSYDLRLDSLGSAKLAVPPGAYSLGFVYQPGE